MIELLTEKEAAARLRISERTLRNIRGQGDIAYVRIGKRIVRYRPEDCDSFIESRVHRAKPPQPTFNNRIQVGGERRAGGEISKALLERQRANGIVPFSQREGAKKKR